jgi:hypothetical protein
MLAHVRMAKLEGGRFDGRRRRPVLEKRRFVDTDPSMRPRQLKLILEQKKNRNGL